MKFLIADDTALRDLAHRVFWTAVEAFIAILIADAVLTLDIAVWQAAVSGAIGSALVVVKEFARKQLGTRTVGPAVTTDDS